MSPFPDPTADPANEQEAAAYLTAKFDQIREAVAAGKNRTAAEVLDSIRVDGHVEAWRAAWDAMLDVAPERMKPMFGTPGQAKE